MNRFCSIMFIVLFSSLTAGAQGWIWGRGSIGNNTSAWPVATDKSGNAYVAGVSSGSVSFNNFLPPITAGGNLGLLAKYDGNGDFLWVRNAQNGSNTYPLDITTDTGGNCYLLGWSPDADVKIGGHTLHNASYPHVQYFIAKFDPMGDVSWIRSAGSHAGSLPAVSVLLDGTNAASIRRQGGIAVDVYGSVYVAVPFNALTITLGATTLANANTDPFYWSDDILLARYDASGNILWVTSSGGSGTEIPSGITVTPQGSVYVSGIFNSDSIRFAGSLITNTSTGPQRWNGLVAKYNNDGAPVWAGATNGPGNTYATGVTSDTANNIYLVGGSTGNNINVAGVNVPAPYSGTTYMFLLKFDTSDVVSWNKTVGSPVGGITCGYSVATSPGGIVWVTGSFTKIVAIDGHYIDVPVASVDPVFIAGFEPHYGFYQGADALQSGGSRQAGIASSSGAVYLCSDYKYPCWPFIVGENVLPPAYQDQSWLYLAKYVLRSAGGPVLGEGEHTSRRDTTVCLEGGIDIALKARQGYLLYTWNDGTTDSVLSVTAPGTYWVKAMSPTDVARTDTIHVKTFEALCNCDAFMPNAFSPNADGRNDTYGPVMQSGCLISKYAFAIYNRWGEQVFYTENPYQRWNGMYKNVPAELGVYMFYLRYAVNPSYPEYTKKGDMTVVR